MLHYSKYLWVLVVLLSWGVFSGCGSGVNLFAKSEDIKLGQKMQAQISSDPKNYPVYNNAAVTSYVQGIVNRIVQSPNVKNKDFNYHVTIINDNNTVNAFSIPGGPIYVYTGLLKFIDNEATLAGILAHEITHADHRHGTQQLSQQYGLQIVASAAVGQSGSGLTAEMVNAIAGIGGQLAMLRFSRDDERDADKTSFDDLMSLSGRPWYPAAIKYFMVKTLSADPKGSLARNLATHPPSQERLDNVNKQAADAHLGEPTEATLQSVAYKKIKSMLP